MSAAAACADAPPDELAGFRLGAKQADVLATARRHGGDFRCTLRGTQPKQAWCSGTTESGRVHTHVRGDALVTVRLTFPDDPDAERRVRRFARDLGDAAWRDRPASSRDAGAPVYSTLWPAPDSSRVLELFCAERRLMPPCSAELRRSTPLGVRMRRDTLLGIRR